jgi:predicted amidohydrolase
VWVVTLSQLRPWAQNAVMRIHAVQLSTDLVEPQAERVARAADLVRAQHGADLVVLPELWAQGGFAFRTFADTAEPLDGPTVAALAAAVQDLGAWVHGGSIVERADDGRLYNCSVLFRPDGTLAATYRKLHLFGFSGGETTVLTAGVDVVTADVDGLTVALATCYDLRFPELFRSFVDRGAELFLVPAAWPTPRIGHWSLLARARAVEDQAYVVACNGTGEQEGLRLGGLSVVVDPWGTVLAEADEDETVLVVDIDPALVAKTRAEFPVLADRRL